MIHCWVKHRLERRQEEPLEDDDDRQLQRSSCHTAVVRRPGFFKLEAAQANAGFSSCLISRNDPRDALFFLDRRPAEQNSAVEQNLCREENAEFAQAEGSGNGEEKNDLEAWSSSATQGSLLVSSLMGSRRNSDLKMVSSNTNKQDLQLSNDLLSAIKNVVRNAVDSLGEEHHCPRRDSSMDFVADDLLGELEKAAKQVADMEAEMKFLKDRVKVSEERGSKLEQTLAKVLEKNPMLEDDNCEARLRNAARRLAFMEEICRKKDLTILELEREVSHLQSKITQLLSMKGQQRVGPVTIKELLVKIGSAEAEDSTSFQQVGNSVESLASTAATKRRPTTMKKTRRRLSNSKSSSSGILMDMVPNLPVERRRLDYVGSNVSKENAKEC